MHKVVNEVLGYEEDFYLFNESKIIIKFNFSLSIIQLMYKVNLSIRHSKSCRS